MNNKHYLDMLSHVIVQPITDISFLHKDQYYLLIKAYRQYTNSHISEDTYAEFLSNLMNTIMIGIRMQHIDDVKLISQMFYPIEYISTINKENKNELHIINHHYFFEILCKLSTNLITLRDGLPSIKLLDSANKDIVFNALSTFEKVEFWNTLCRYLTPDVLIILYYIQNGLDNPDYLINLPANITLCDKPLNKVLKKGIAETHLHLNAGCDYITTWELVTDLDLFFENKIIYKKEPILLMASILRFVMAEYFEAIEKRSELFEEFFERRFKGSSLIRNVIDVLLNKIDKDFTDLAKQFSNESITEKENILSETICDYLESSDFLRRNVYSQYDARITSEYLLLAKWTRFIYNTYASEGENQNYHHVLYLFIQYLRLKNYYFKDKFQKNYLGGLDYFQRFYNKSADAPYTLRDDKLTGYLSIFRSLCRIPNLKILEFKITPPCKSNTIEEIKVDVKKQLIRIFEAFLKYCKLVFPNISERDTHIPSSNHTYNIPNIGIVYHFIKINSLDNKTGHFCWVHNNIDMTGQSMDYWHMQGKYMQTAKAIAELISEVPNLDDYLVGIDAASIENNTEPWVFAPVFYEARNRRVTKPVYIANQKPIKNIGFTYHVGEDFRHLLSGFRHMDEVIDKLGYNSGDRLGHGIALGISVKQWVKEHPIVVLPKMEYLENLLWLWGLSKDNRYAGTLYENIEYRIMALADDIYGDTKGLTPYILWKAYNKKFERMSSEKIKNLICKYGINNPANDFARDVTYSENCTIKRLFCRFADKHSPHTLIWDEEQITATYHCPSFVKEYEKPIFVKVSEEEIPILTGIQEFLLQKVEKLGVYVETNPTSNTVIGDIDSLYTHPLLFLNSSGLITEERNRHAVMVTINSDDPSVFNTNLENEIAYIYHALIHNKYRREDVLQWIDKIREHGINSSFVIIKEPQQQYLELSDIVKKLKN